MRLISLLRHSLALRGKEMSHSSTDLPHPYSPIQLKSSSIFSLTLSASPLYPQLATSRSGSRSGPSHPSTILASHPRPRIRPILPSSFLSRMSGYTRLCEIRDLVSRYLNGRRLSGSAESSALAPRFDCFGAVIPLPEIPPGFVRYLRLDFL